MSAVGPPRDWDAATYDRVSDPQVGWGLEVMGRLALRGDETVLDAGCGTGRVTATLLERLPYGRVVAVDAAPSMAEKTRAALPEERAEVICADLTALRLEEPVDAVFSSAVFHWVPDHALLFQRLFRALRPGGRLEAQCGGEGNVEIFHAAAREVAEEDPFAPHLGGWEGPWRFASAEDTAALLRAAGFADVRCWLVPRTVEPPEPGDYLRTVCLGYHVLELPEELREDYVDAVVERLGRPVTLDYVRLNISATRAFV